VIFSVSPDVYEIIAQSEAWAGLCAEHMDIGRGCWQGVEEIAFCLPKEVFDEMNRRWPFILHDQEAVLILGTPESQNWRPATFWSPSLGQLEDAGTWLEVTEEEARASEGWSYFNGHWFTCQDDPPDSVSTAEERLLEAKAAAFDRIMEVMNASYDWNTKSEPQAIADMIASRMEQANAAKAKVAHMATAWGADALLVQKLEAEVARWRLLAGAEKVQPKEKADDRGAALVEALRLFIDQEVDYMTRNNLGDPEKQHSVRVGRAALAAWEAGA
jgi:hypothetical protein